jgi:chemotaxis protein methyltransferase CheR
MAHRQGRKRAAVKHFMNVNELLSGFSDDEVVPGSEGLTAGRMKELIGILS